MHYFILILVAEGTPDIQAETQRLTGPKLDPDVGDSCCIGGQFDQELDGYDPEKDPANRERCDLCNGTGTRLDWIRIVNQDTDDEDWRRYVASRAELTNGCNGCWGEGTRMKRPLDRPHGPHWVVPVSALKLQSLPAVVVTPDGVWHGTRPPVWSGEISTDEAERWTTRVGLLLAEHGHCLAVVGDYHI